MYVNEINHQIEVLRKRTTTLQQHIKQRLLTPTENATEDALGELLKVLDALCIIEEDLRQQNEALQIAQLAIAAERRLYEASQAQIAELEQLNHLKDAFLSTVSHELRTPLTNMKMALHVLTLNRSEEQRSRCLQILQTECDREINLITDLLDLQRLETNTYPVFVPESITLQTWMPTILAPLRHRLETRQQLFTLRLSDTLPPLLTDQASLRRLLLELLYNAHKYTPVGGEVILQIHHTFDYMHIVFTIQNQAEIPAAELPHIFEKFYRVPQADPWQVGGTGLGLALAKQLVKQLNGTIDVESSNGWTIFTVQFPIQSIGMGNGK